MALTWQYIFIMDFLKCYQYTFYWSIFIKLVLECYSYTICKFNVTAQWL